MFDLAALTREFVEMIDERFCVSPRKWTPGTWVLAIFLLALLGAVFNAIYMDIFKPLYGVLRFASDGKLLAAIGSLYGMILFKAFLGTALTVFIIAFGVNLIYMSLLSLARTWRSYPRGLGKELGIVFAATRGRFRRIVFFVLSSVMTMILLAYILGTIILAYSIFLNPHNPLSH